MYKHQGIQKETPKAFFITVRTNAGPENVWLPKSQVTIDGDYVELPTWLAKKKGMTTEVEETIFDAFLEEENGGNEAEAALANEEVLDGELQNCLDAIKRACDLTGKSKAELLLEIAKAA